MDEDKVTYKEKIHRYDYSNYRVKNNNQNNLDHHVFNNKNNNINNNKNNNINNNTSSSLNKSLNSNKDINNIQNANAINDKRLDNGKKIDNNQTPFNSGNQGDNKYNNVQNNNVNSGNNNNQNNNVNNGNNNNNNNNNNQNNNVNNGNNNQNNNVNNKLLNNSTTQFNNNQGNNSLLNPVGNNNHNGSNVNNNGLNVPKNNGNRTNLGNKDALKQKVAKDAITKAAKAYNPALGKAVEKASESKVGKKIIDNAMKRNPFMQKNSIIDKFLPKNSNEPTDGDGKKLSDKSKENSLDKVTMIIMTPKMKIILPITIACCVVVFGVCILMVCAQTNYSILGVDLSSQVSLDSSDVQNKLMVNQDTMGNDEVDNLITDNGSTTSSSSSSTSSRSTSSGSSSSTSSSSGNTSGTNYVTGSTTSSSDGRLKKINIENGFSKQVFYYSQSDYGESYGGYGSIGSHGCGPTSLAIVISSILQEPHDPIELTNYMCNKGWCSDSGASWEQVVSTEKEYASKYGFKQKSVSDLNELREMIKGGNALAVTIMSTGGGRPNIIFNDGTGMFFAGHFFVIAGIAPNGDAIVVDPSSHGGNNGKSTSLEVLAENNHNSSSEPSFWVVYK